MRTTLGTNLARAGVAPQLCQKILRHADYKTTLKHYTVLGIADTNKAINQLPNIQQEQREAATGTCDENPQEACVLKRQQLAHETEQIGAIRCESGKRENPNADDCKSLEKSILNDVFPCNATGNETSGRRGSNPHDRLGRPRLYH